MSGKEVEVEGKDDVGIVEKVKAYFMEAEDFEITFMGWAKDHCDEVDLESDEMKLVYTELHNEFLEFFEGKMEAIIQEFGSTVKEFYREVKKSANADPDGDDSLFVQIMLAVCEFDVFLSMLQDAKRIKAREAEEEASSHK